MKGLLVVVFICLSFTSYGQMLKTLAPFGDTTIYEAVEYPPEFPGGEDALSKYISKNLYADPKYAHLSSRIVLYFVVEKDGSLSHFTQPKQSNPKWGQNLIRLLRSSQKWKPGIQKSRFVRARYSIPVNICFFEE